MTYYMMQQKMFFLDFQHGSKGENPDLTASRSCEIKVDTFYNSINKFYTGH